MSEAGSERIFPVSRARHAGRTWRPHADYGFARSQILVALLAVEVPRAAGNYPVVFLKVGESFQPAALLGLEPGENLLVSAQGQWLGDHVPALLRGHPFMLGRSPAGQGVLCVDESALLPEGEAGQPLLLEDGALADEVRKTAEFLAKMEAWRAPTAAACAALARHGCIVPMEALSPDTTAAPRPSGLFQVSEAALVGLPDEHFLELRRCGALPLAYGQLSSMARLPQLVRLRALRASQRSKPAGPDLSDLYKDGSLQLDFLG